MTPDDRAQLRALLAAATPGEWAPGTPDDDVAEEPPMTLPTCPREDCTFTGPHHDHDKRTGEVRDRSKVTDCQCDASTPYYTRCYAPRTPQPQPAAVVLPTVDEVADVLRSGDGLRFYSDSARDILDLVAAHLPVWQPVEPGTVIKAGTRWRCESGEGATLRVEEETAATPYTCRPSACRYFIDPRTVPAEPEDPRVAVVAKAMSDALDDNGVTTCDWTAEARDILAKLDGLDR